jgi:DNA polymerase III sliding clamp (beta) subunit (PCNA family)
MKALIKTEELIRVIKALKPFTRKDSQYTDKKMEHIYIEFNQETKEARFEALDGYRVAVEYVKCQTDESFIAYIKPFTPWKTDTVYAEIELDNQVAIVDMGFYSLKFVQPEGEWFATKKMIEETEAMEPSVKIGINPDYLIEALKGINSYGCRKLVVIETRGKKDPVIIREEKDRRNMRYVLPVSLGKD